jgi:hypothetical protein
MAWHGTSESISKKIVASNFFNPDQCTTQKDEGWFGIGINFTQHPSYGITNNSILLIVTIWQDVTMQI